MSESILSEAEIILNLIRGREEEAAAKWEVLKVETAKAEAAYRAIQQTRYKVEAKLPKPEVKSDE